MKSPLMKVIEAAANRFDKRPIYRASIEARRELLYPDLPMRCDIDSLLEYEYNRIFTEEGKKLVGPFLGRPKK